MFEIPVVRSFLWDPDLSWKFLWRFYLVASVDPLDGIEYQFRSRCAHLCHLTFLVAFPLFWGTLPGLTPDLGYHVFVPFLWCQWMFGRTFGQENKIQIFAISEDIMLRRYKSSRFSWEMEKDLLQTWLQSCLASNYCHVPRVTTFEICRGRFESKKINHNSVRWTGARADRCSSKDSFDMKRTCCRCIERGIQWDHKDYNWQVKKDIFQSMSKATNEAKGYCNWSNCVHLNVQNGNTIEKTINFIVLRENALKPIK